MSDTLLYKRKFSLFVIKDDNVLDLSEMHCKFKTEQADTEVPNNASIRVYNLTDKTIQAVKEFTRVVIQAGYEANFGVIFDGTIKQFGIGRENATDTYLDIFAADGDLAYNFSLVNTTLAPGASQSEQLQAALDAMALGGVYLGYKPGDVGVTTLPRGKTSFALGRDVIRTYAQTNKMTWSIQNGKINIIPLDGYKPGQIPDVNATSGLIGQPQQTANGIHFVHLLSPAFKIGQAIRINNDDINQLIAQEKNPFPTPYNQRTGTLNLAKTASDGLYRLLVAEHEGDTRGQAWYTNVIALAIDASSNKVKPYG